MQNPDGNGRSGSGNTPRGPGSTGCRIHKPEYDRARDAAETWTGHEDGLDHHTLLDLLEIKRVAEHFGLRKLHTDYLRLSFRKLRQEDFEPGDWPPVVWMNKDKLADKLHISPRTVSDIEKDLARAGFLYWNDTASRRRDGKRGKHDGRIYWAYGVNFSPFAAMAEQIEDIARQVKEEEIERKGLIHEIATIRCHTRILLQAALRRNQDPASAIHTLLARVLSLPAAKGMQNSDVHAVRSLAADARLVQEHALALTEPRQAAPGELAAEEPDASDSAPSEDEKGAENCTLGYAPDTGSNSITHQFQENTLGAADPSKALAPEQHSPAAARLWPEREDGSQFKPATAPVPGGPPAWLILDSLSPRLARFLPAGRLPAADEFVRAANRTRSELGISPEAWREACTALSPAWASLAVVVVASRDDVGEIHTSAGGYFRKLTEQARKETRKLAMSLWGAVERSEELHVARFTGPTDSEHSVPGPDSNSQGPANRIDRQRADQATMTAICRTATDPKGLTDAWRDLVARYRCWPYVDEVERHYADLQPPFSGEPKGTRQETVEAIAGHSKGQPS